MLTTPSVSLKTPSNEASGVQDELVSPNYLKSWSNPSLQERLLDIMDREANKALGCLSWSPDMIGQTMMTVCAGLCEAHRMFTSYATVKLLFSQLSPYIQEVQEEQLFSDDWTNSHQHSYSDGCKFLCCTSDLLRNLVFESQLQQAVTELIPCHAELRSLRTGKQCLPTNRGRSRR